MIYEGSFLSGKYEGDGAAYTSDGRLLYEGGFRSGLYDGTGTLYDPATGKVVEMGEFRNGVLVTPQDELDGSQNQGSSSSESSTPEETVSSQPTASQVETSREASLAPPPLLTGKE